MNRKKMVSLLLLLESINGVNYKENKMSNYLQYIIATLP